MVWIVVFFVMPACDSFGSACVEKLEENGVKKLRFFFHTCPHTPTPPSPPQPQINFGS
jgi:hypothetical protein